MDTTTEPVRIAGAISGAVKALVPEVIAMLIAFNAWHVTEDQIATIMAALGGFIALVTAVTSVWQRSKVTPFAPVAAKLQAAAEAAQTARREGEQQGAVTAVKALAANDVPAAVAATTGVTIHDLRYSNGEPVVAPPPAGGATPPPVVKR